MKKNVVSTLVLSLVLSAASPAFISCSGNTDEATTETQETAVAEEEDIQVIYAAYEAPEGFTNSFQKATEDYLALKDALVESNPEEVQRHAAALNSALNEVDATTLEGDAAQQWNTVAEDLKSGAATIAGTTDLAVQRKTFTALSEDMIAAAENFGAGTTVYKQYCPMANSNAGGSWLSNNKEVRNPYYGDAMLECGEVQAAIQNKE